MPLRPLLVLVIAFTIGCTGAAQTKDSNASSAKPSATANSTEKTPAKSARELEAARLLKERRANAQSLLISLAADARSFNDMVTRGRTLARVASVLWTGDPERARTMFHSAWDAAEIADKEILERAKSAASKSGADSYSVPLPIRYEVIRLAARRDRALGEEFLAKMKEETRREHGGVLAYTSGPLGISDPFLIQRLDTARQMLNADEIDRAMQFAEPVLNIVGQFTVDFLSSVRERKAQVADDRYTGMLASAATNQLSDANTVSLLASYLFTPHIYIGYTSEGTYTNSHPGNLTPPNVNPQLRLAFFRTASAILLRPLAAPGEENNTAGHDGHYLVIKRLMPLFEQYAPPELSAGLKAQLQSLTSLTSGATRGRDDDDWVKTGIRPDNFDENLEKSLRDLLDHAKTSDERDIINLELATHFVDQDDLRARDFVDQIADSEMRKKARTLIDIRLAERAIARKNTERMIELTRTGEFDHIHRARLSAQAATLLAKSDNEKAASLVELAIAEARRISPSDADAPRAFLAAANAMLLVNRSAVWETLIDAVKNANSAEGFTGEDGELDFQMKTKDGITWTAYQKVPEFDLTGIFKSLADFDYDKAVELARGLSKESTRSVATIAIAQAVLEAKKK